MPSAITHPQEAYVAEKFLFLDFDGPLHPTPTLQGKNVGLLANNPAALRNAGFFRWSDHLEHLLQCAEHANPGTRINVIVHSSWRAQAWFSLPVIREALGQLGERICGFTRMELGRGPAVQELCDRMGIDDYLILDDDVAAFNVVPAVREHLVPIHPLRGVMDAHVDLALMHWACAEAPVPTGMPVPAQA